MPQHEIKINLPGLLKMLGSNIYAELDNHKRISHHEKNWTMQDFLSILV